MAAPMMGQELAFPEIEYEKRLHAVQKNLSQRNLSGAVLFDPENIFWLTGFQTIGYFTFQCLLILKDDKPILLSRQVNGFLAAVTPTLSQFVGIKDHKSPIRALIDLISHHYDPSDALGLETKAWYLTVHDYLELKLACGLELSEWNGYIDEFRKIKDPSQIKCMRSAARAAEAGLEAALDAVKIGASENDLAAAMHSASIAAGSEYLGHPPLAS